jgi:hypothetical protein
MNDILIANLLEEIRRTEGNDPSFIIGYLSGLLAQAADRSPDVRDWLQGYLNHLILQPSAA